MVHVKFWSSNWKHHIRDELAEDIQTCIWDNVLEISFLAIGLLTTLLASAGLLPSHSEINRASDASVFCLHPLLSTYI